MLAFHLASPSPWPSIHVSLLFAHSFFSPIALGSRSVSAGLHSLDTSGKLEEEFDMFAVTRGSSLAEQRRE